VIAEIVQYIVGIACVLALFVAFGLYARACGRL
jgi:hypothetical protein